MISVHNLKKSFGNVQVLKGINIEIRKVNVSVLLALQDLENLLF